VAAAAGDGRARGAPPEPAGLVPDMDGRGGARHLRPRRGGCGATDGPGGGAWVFESFAGIPIEPLDTPESLGDWSYADKLGKPGEYPFTRGVYPTMYRGRLWTLRMFGGFAPPGGTKGWVS